MENVLIISYLILLSTVKFLFVPFISVHVHNYDFLTSSIISISGGLIGVSFFFKTSAFFIDRAIKKRKKAILNKTLKRKKVFTRVNRLLVSVKNTMGMYGLAFLILPFISIPICSIVAAKYYHLKKKKMLLLLYTSTIAWSFFLSAIANLLD